MAKQPLWWELNYWKQNSKLNNSGREEGGKGKGEGGGKGEGRGRREGSGREGGGKGEEGGGWVLANNTSPSSTTYNTWSDRVHAILQTWVYLLGEFFLQIPNLFLSSSVLFLALSSLPSLPLSLLPFSPSPLSLSSLFSLPFSLLPSHVPLSAQWAWSWLSWSEARSTQSQHPPSELCLVPSAS